MFTKSQLDAFDEFVEQFSLESQRAAIILSGAKLDQQLFFLLSKYLRPLYSNSLGNPYEGDGPIATFNARINLCYMLGLINADFARALHLVRKIRNDFAHRLDARLDQGTQRDRARDLVRMVRETEFFEDVKAVYFSGESNFIIDYYIALTVLAVRIETITIITATIDGNCEAAIMPNKYL